jgi:hypothetical protein
MQTMNVITTTRLKTGNSSSITNSNSNSRLSMSSSNLLSLRHYLNGPGVGKYGRQSSIGLNSNDLTLTKSPAFSIGKAARFNDYNSSLLTRSPGKLLSKFCDLSFKVKFSKYFLGPIYCPIIIKKRSPTFFICSRYREMTKTITPGPGAYAPEKHLYPFKRSIPAFSIGKASRWPNIVV